MKKPMHLVTKMRIAKITTLTLLSLVVGIGIDLVLDRGSVSTMTWWTSFVVGILALVGHEFARTRFMDYRIQFNDAWREHVKRRGIALDDLLEMMRGLPSGGEEYTSEEANCLVAACRGGILVVRGLHHTSLRHIKNLRSLEKNDWLLLTFDDGPSCEVVALPTDQAWAAIDQLRPKGWSPEDTLCV